MQVVKTIMPKEEFQAPEAEGKGWTKEDTPLVDED